MSLFMFSGCETYGDFDQKFSSIYPLAGEWVVNVYDTDGEMYPDGDGWTCTTFNTSENVSDKMWIKLGGKTNMWGILGKTDCSVPTLEFGSTNIVNLVHAVDGVNSEFTFSISKGKVVLDGYNTASGHKADAIEFTLTNSKFPDQVMVVKGFRRTGWSEDE